MMGLKDNRPPDHYVQEIGRGTSMSGKVWPCDSVRVNTIEDKVVPYASLENVSDVVLRF